MDRIEALRAELSRRCPALEARAGEPMSRHTTFRIGGPAALFLRPETPDQAAAALSACAACGVRPFFLGNGSNLLVDDAGYGGVVISSGGLDEIRWKGEMLYAGSGALLSRAAAAALEGGLSGLEFAAGIPGSAGGAAAMNAGAYGGEMSQVTAWVDVLEPDSAARRVPAADCDFSYRSSAFSGGERFITGVCFHLTAGDREAVRARMDELSQRRKASQPLEFPSAGSVFKRPAGHFAGALIEGCGLKGLSVGGAQVSEKHAGFIINRGGASCADVLALVEQVRARVLAETGVPLELEIKILH